MQQSVLIFILEVYAQPTAMNTSCTKNSSILLAFWWLPLFALGQFAPAAGEVGSTAIAHDSSILVAWATGCTVQRGPMDNSQPNLGAVNAGTAQQATGAAGDGFTVSLGDGGSATLVFARPIRNGVGADFAVFENGFSNTFLELAFVEVSSDGQHFVRFPAVSNSDTSTQIGTFGAVNPRHLYNLAGKYRARFGTPFDLEELRADSAVLNLQAVTHVRLVDAVGSIQAAYASRDSRGHPVNDPWPTPFASSGFDLDAVGVIHEGIHNNLVKLPVITVAFFPNPLPRGQALNCKATTAPPEKLLLYNALGQCLWQGDDLRFPLSFPTLPSGLYRAVFWVDGQAYTQSIVLL